MASVEREFLPPYNIPWATFMNSVEKVAADLPNKVDRSYLGSMSGGLKSYLISAFRSFGLLLEDLTVSEELRALAKDPEGRPARIGSLLAQYYPRAVELGKTNATPGELDSAFAEMFPSISGESRTKAIRFYLSACDYAGVAKSPLWKSPKAAGASTPRRGRSKKTENNNGEGNSAPRTTVGQSLREFKLPSGHVLTVSLSTDVLALGRGERKFVMGIVDQIEEHIEENASANAEQSVEGDPAEN